jgi:hypothetical protein
MENKGVRRLNLLKRASISFVIMLFILLVLSSSAYAHVPLQGEGNGIDDAVKINEPLKSWVIYTEYKDTRSLYYTFDLSVNDRLKAGLLTVDQDFIPDLTIMGPGLPLDFGEHFHEEFEIPHGYGLFHIHGEKQTNKVYEPFTPSSYYPVLDVDLTVNESGTYFLIVDATIGSGKVGIVIGYVESFTIVEWLKVPFDVAFVHHWEGQDYLVILLPMILIVVGGLLLNGYYLKIPLDVSQAFAFIGSLTYFGSAAIILQQMIKGLIGATYDSLVFVTPIFIFLPAVLGYSIFRQAQKRDQSRGQQIRLFIYGLIGLFFWAGYVIGPVLVLISVFMTRA